VGEPIRAFVALELPEEARSLLASSVEDWKDLDSGVRWVAAENLHVTLKFFGNVSPEVLSKAVEAVRRAGRDVPAFDFRPEGYGAFPDLRRCRVLWAGAGEGADKIGALAARIDTALAAAGFEAEERGFHAHVTLARVKRGAISQKLQERIRQAPFPDCGPVRAGEIVFFRSRLSSRGARYEAIERVPLL